MAGVPHFQRMVTTAWGFLGSLVKRRLVSLLETCPSSCKAAARSVFGVFKRFFCDIKVAQIVKKSSKMALEYKICSGCADNLVC